MKSLIVEDFPDSPEVVDCEFRQVLKETAKILLEWLLYFNLVAIHMGSVY